VNFNKLYAAFAGSILCLAATSHAGAAVNQTGALLWTTDLVGEHTDVSVTPVVFSQPEWSGGTIAFTASAAAFTGDAGGLPGAILTGLDTTTGWGVGPGGTLTPAPGMPTTNYLESAKGGSITMTPPAAESYLSFLTRSADPFNVTLYSGRMVLGTLTASQLAGSASASGYAWFNIDTESAYTFTSVVFSETTPTTDTDRVFFVSYGNTQESLTSLTGAVPLPALAGTLPGFALAVLGMFGLRRRGGCRA